jgi:hypothetical protein
MDIKMQQTRTLMVVKCNYSLKELYIREQKIGDMYLQLYDTMPNVPIHVFEGLHAKVVHTKGNHLNF